MYKRQVRVSPNNGQIVLMSSDSRINWPYYFDNEILITNASGLIIWRKISDSYRILSDNLEINFPGVFSQSNLEMTLPISDGEPIIDLELIISNSNVYSLINNFRFSYYKNEMIDLIHESFSSLVIDNLFLSYKGKAKTDYLFKNGIFAQAIRYPTVPKDQARIRMSLTAKLEKKQILSCLTILEKSLKKFNVI